MRKSVVLAILLVFLIGILSFVIFNRISFYESNSKKQNQSLERIGEKITYSVKLGKINLGEAKFHHVAQVELEGKQVNLIKFDTKVVGFTDSEKIYSDIENFLPIRVERDISSWPTPEKITEIYDQENFTLTIKKLRRKKESQILIEKDKVIHNAILLPYQVRRMAELEKGWFMAVNLPRHSFEIKLVAIEDVIVPAGRFRSYHFESIPKKFEIWISADERRIPLKIKGTTGFGYTLLMKEYSL